MALPDQVFSHQLFTIWPDLSQKPDTLYHCFLGVKHCFSLFKLKKNKKQEDQAIDYQPSASLMIFSKTAAGFLCKICG
jgi:hypothetical protein